MILTVEIPREGKPHCWFAFDEDDFIRKVRIARPNPDAVVFAMHTPKQLLEARGEQPGSPGLEQRHADLVALGTEHGWETVLYRADYLLAPGHYQTEEVSEFVAHVAFLLQDLADCRIYPDEEQAMDALDQDPLYDRSRRECFYAHMALREQLIALEVMADDM